MTLYDYLQKCLKNDEFRELWEEAVKELSEESVTEDVDIWEALRLIENSEMDELQSIIDNKGILATLPTTTTIEFFEMHGECPVAEFIDNISNQKLKMKTLKNVVELSVLGASARPPLSKYVEDGIYELRTKQGSNIDRIFYFFVFGNKIILTNGYIKKSQKIDKDELKRAKRYRDIYSKLKEK